MSDPFDPIRFTVSDLQRILFGQSSGGHNQRSEIRRLMKQMDFHERQAGYEVANPRQFVALTEALWEELTLGHAPARRAKKGEEVRALEMRLPIEPEC